MAIALVAGSKNVIGTTGVVATPQTVSPAATISSGSKIFVAAYIGRSSPAGLAASDNSTQAGVANVYTTVGTLRTSTNIALQVFWCDVTRPILSTDAISIAWTGGTAAFAAAVSEWTGCSPGAPVSVVGASNTTGTPAAGALSAATVGDLVIGWFDWAAAVAFTVGTDGQGNTMTLLNAPTAASSKGGGSQYEFAPGTAAYNPTNTSVSTNAWAAIAVRATAAVPAPTNTIAPAVTGTATVGSTLSCTTGTWSNDVSSGYAYQWKDAGGNIAAATSSTYVIGAGESGASIHCTVTATGTGGSSSADSNTVGPVASTGFPKILQYG